MSKHLRGYQWRESKKAIAKKERAKKKSLSSFSGIDDGTFFLKEPQKSSVVGLVADVRGESLDIYVGDELVHLGRPRYSSKANKDMVVGDHVIMDDNDNWLSIKGVVVRSNVLVRMRRDETRRHTKAAEAHRHIIAANVDLMVVVVSAKEPPLHPKFIDRWLVIAQNSGIDPLVCVNKCELEGDAERAVIAKYASLGIDIIETSAIKDIGIDGLKSRIAGKMVVFVGHSGVGKSSLINKIAPGLNLKVGGVSQKSKKGTHTTTFTKVYKWGKGSYIIDTPGIRSLKAWGIDKKSLQYYFDEFAPYLGKCKYYGCMHLFEPSCAVRNAVDNGAISKERYGSYIKILEEL